MAIKERGALLLEFSFPTKENTDTVSLDMISDCPVDFYIDGVPRSLSEGSGSDSVKVEPLGTTALLVSYVDSSMTLRLIARRSVLFGCFF